MLNIDNIKLHNFYSYKDECIDISKYNNQIVIIKGKNGAGKSTIFEAIVWGLTGKTVRKSTEPAMINNVAKKDCTVELSLNNGSIKIVRGKRPTFLKFVVDGEDRTQDAVTATQAVIDRTLNIDYKTLMASMVWGQHNTVDFLSVSPEDKRLIMKNFLSIDTVFRYREIVKKDKSELNLNIRSLETKLEVCEKDVKRLKISLGDLEEINCPEGFENIEDIKKKEEKRRLSLKTEELYLEELKKEKGMLFTQYTNFNQWIKIGPKVENEICSECGSATGILEITEDHIEKYKIQRYEVEEKLEILELKIEEVKDKIDILNVSFDLTEYLKYQEYITKKKTYESELSLSEIKYHKIKEKFTSSKLDLDLLKFWERAFSEQGLVKYVIRNILSYFNEQCNYFLSFITKGEYKITFDEELNETIYQNEKEVYYISLSGGEGRKVSLSILLALRSLLDLSGKEQSNILLLDEIAENLDSEGLDGLVNLLNELKFSRTIFLITHDKYLKTLLDSSARISIVKEGNYSHIWDSTLRG